jgi:hypothetical protein
MQLDRRNLEPKILQKLMIFFIYIFNLVSGYRRKILGLALFRSSIFQEKKN